MRGADSGDSAADDNEIVCSAFNRSTRLIFKTQLFERCLVLGSVCYNHGVAPAIETGHIMQGESVTS